MKESMMKKTYSRPILSSLFDVLAVLVFIGAIVCAVGAFVVPNGALRWPGLGAAGTLLFSGIIYIGIGQVIDYLARSAYFAELNALQGQEQRERMLNEMARQSVLLQTMMTEADETAGDRYAAAEEGRKFHEKSLAFQARADAHHAHTNELLKWLGESRDAQE
jgi:hypothetical protein